MTETRDAKADEFIRKLKEAPVWLVKWSDEFFRTLELHVWEDGKEVVYLSPDAIMMTQAEYHFFLAEVGKIATPGEW